MRASRVRSRREKQPAKSVTLDYIYFVVDRTVYENFIVLVTKRVPRTDPLQKWHFPTRPSRAREVDPAEPDPGLCRD